MAVTPTAYCAVADLSTFGAPSGALAGIDAGVLQGAVDGANAEADSYLANIFTLPLTSWGRELVKFAVQIAIYDVFVTRGYDPGSPELAEQIEKRADDARRWFRMVAKGEVTPTGVVDSSGVAVQQQGPGGPFVVQATIQPQTSGASNPLASGSQDTDGGFSVVVGRPRLRGW